MMKHSEFVIGEEFWCSGRQWRCTDIGTRTIIAICLDSITVESSDPALCRPLSRAEAEAAGWFKGPPYASTESVFDEYSMETCSLQRDYEDERLDAEAEADYAAGRFVTHDKVREWLKSWGTPNKLPCPKPDAD